jgi:predicted deacylase
MWTICGHALDPGQKMRTEIMAAENYAMPVTLICGGKPGKTLLITAGIHGSEYPGTMAIARLADEIDPAKLTGNLLLIHCVNTGGFWKKTNGVVPEDGANLNANYPGKPDGTVGERIAAYFVTEIFPHVDFVLDMHSGGMTEPLTPCLFFPGAEKVRAESLAAARSMSIPFLIESSAASGEYSYAANHMDIPGLLVERGHSGYCLESWVTDYLRDLRLLLKYRGMYGFGGMTTAPKKVYRRAVYLTSEVSGLWRPAVKEGQRIYKNQLLGVIENFYGERIAEYLAVGDGLVLYYSAGLAVCRGDNLVAYGLEASVQE